MFLLSNSANSKFCDTDDPSQRIYLLQNVLSALNDRYISDYGLPMFVDCDPLDPNIPEDCMNFNNPSLYYGGEMVPCSESPCPQETPAALPEMSSYIQPSKNDAVLTFGCLPPPCEYFSIRSYLYERNKVTITGTADEGNNGDDIGQRPPDPTTDERYVADTPWYDSYNHLNINSTARQGLSLIHI